MAVFPRELNPLDSEALEHLEIWLMALASMVADQARQMRDFELVQARGKAEADRLASAPQKVLDLLRRGYNSPESAMEAAARDMNIPLFTVEAQYQTFLKTQTRENRAARDRLILDLVRCGLKNDEIAERLGIHRNTISRAISAHLAPHLRPVDRARLRKRRTAAAG